jgi:hypothetical protein
MCGKLMVPTLNMADTTTVSGDEANAETQHDEHVRKRRRSKRSLALLE